MKQHNKTFFETIEQIYSASGVGQGEAEAASPPARRASSSYLESDGKHCDGEKKEQEKYEIACVGCRSRFCRYCCVGLGLALRSRLMPILESFKGLMMWTFTLDPSLFTSPQAAYEYVRENRCISNTMRRLKQRGFLNTSRYFVVVEWQEQTQMPHFHVLADASFIPFNVVCELWNRFRPASAGPVQGQRPGFGSVRFTAPVFADAKHAACYACKYLITYPQFDYPAWVLDSHDIHRFSTSRGFWGDTPDAVPAQDEPAESIEQEEEEEAIEAPAESEEPRTTIRERLSKCGEKAVVLRLAECVDEATGELTTRREFVGRLNTSLSTVASMLGVEVTEGKRRLLVTRDDMGKAFRAYGEAKIL